VIKNINLIALARQYFISDSGLSETNLIRKIQIAEGKSDCYMTGKKTCNQSGCRWRAQCLPERKECEQADL